MTNITTDRVDGRIVVQFAEPYSPARLFKHRDESMKVARLVAKAPQWPVNIATKNEMIALARRFHRTAMAGGNYAYLWRVANGLSLV